HAKAGGFPIRWEDTILMDHESDSRVWLEKLRRARNFIRQHGRLPASGQEATEYNNTFQEPTPPEITDPEVLKSLARLEELIKFVEQMEPPDAHNALPR